MSHRIDLFCEDLRQKLTIIESGLQGLKAKVEANEVHAERDLRNHLDRVRIPGSTATASFLSGIFGLVLFIPLSPWRVGAEESGAAKYGLFDSAARPFSTASARPGEAPAANHINASAI